QRFELVEDGQQRDRGQLSHHDQQPHEQSPGEDPPMLGKLADHKIEQLHHDRRQGQSHKKTLGFIPEPGAKSLIGKLEFLLQPESVVIESKTQSLADEKQKEEVEKYGQRV